MRPHPYGYFTMINKQPSPNLTQQILATLILCAIIVPVTLYFSSLLSGCDNSKDKSATLVPASEKNSEQVKAIILSIKKFIPSLACHYKANGDSKYIVCRDGETIEEQTEAGRLQANRIEVDFSSINSPKNPYIQITFEVMNNFHDFSKNKILSRFDYNESSINSFLSTFLINKDFTKIKSQYQSATEPCRKAIKVSKDYQVSLFKGCMAATDRKGFSTKTQTSIGDVYITAYTPDSVEITIEKNVSPTKIP
jgi:hypothetical protein